MPLHIRVGLQMTLNYEQHALLIGHEPLKVPQPGGVIFDRGGKIAEGKLSKMVSRAVKCLDQGYYGLMLLPQSGETYEAAQIREIAARADFPK